MLAVPRGDDDEIGVFAERVADVGCAALESESPAGVPRAQALRRDDRYPAEPLHLREGGERGTASIVTCPEDADPHLTMPPGDGRDAEFHTVALRCVRRLLRIHEEDPQVGLLPLTTQQRVHPVGFLDREPVRDQGLDPEPWGQSEKRSHVSLEGPAHVLVRVVDSLLLVVTVVPAGPVGTRDHEPKLLLVEDPPVEIQPDVPQDHDPPPPARDLGGDRHRGCILGGRRDDDRVGTAPVRPLCDRARERGRVVGHDVAAELAREPRPPLDRIQTEHLASGGFQELHRQLEPGRAQQRLATPGQASVHRADARA